MELFLLHVPEQREPAEADSLDFGVSEDYVAGEISTRWLLAIFPRLQIAKT